jgi:cell division septum initiation protein DivIVA
VATAVTRHGPTRALAIFAFAVAAAPPCLARAAEQEPAPAGAASETGDSVRGGPRPAELAEQPGAESNRVAAETRALERRLASGAARRDALLEEIRRPRSGGPFAALVRAWERRRARAELLEVVAVLQRDQARLLQLRARGRALADADAERDWRRLQGLVDEAADAWRDGRAEQPMLGPAIAEALERAGGESPVRTMERYRTLVDRLARVNMLLAENATPPEPAAAWPPGGAVPGAEASGFLGVAQRGLPLDRRDDEAARETWRRLRATLADEIVATATEITLRVRQHS